MRKFLLVWEAPPLKDLQKANMWKRMSAALLDLILLATLAVGMALLLSTILGYDGYLDRLESCADAYEAEYGVDFDIAGEEYTALSEEKRKQHDDAWAAYVQDETVAQTYSVMLSLALVIVTFGLFLAFLVLEFVVPLLFGNGQTVGKKIFGLGVVREDGIRLSPMLLFVRTVLGKYTVETMLPVFILIMMVFGTMGLAGLIAIAALLLLQVVLLIASPTRTPLHDKLAHTVAVDYASQRIFETPEEQAAYYKRLHDETHGAE